MTLSPEESWTPEKERTLFLSEANSGRTEIHGVQHWAQGKLSLLGTLGCTARATGGNASSMVANHADPGAIVTHARGG